MRQDAFTGGVEPGGLWNKNDIRILLCYLLASVDAPLSGEDIEKIVQERSLANYFEVRDALAALEQLGNVARVAEGLYTVTQAGREIADSLDATLPLSVRDKALEAAFLLLAQARAERENRVETRKTDRGYHVSGGETELMSIRLYVPDRAQAEMVKRNFHRDPGAVYRLLLYSLAGENELLRDFSEE